MLIARLLASNTVILSSVPVRMRRQKRVLQGQADDAADIGAGLHRLTLDRAVVDLELDRLRQVDAERQLDRQDRRLGVGRDARGEALPPARLSSRLIICWTARQSSVSPPPAHSTRQAASVSWASAAAGSAGRGNGQHEAQARQAAAQRGLSDAIPRKAPLWPAV